MKNEINRALAAKKARIFVLIAAMICAVSMNAQTGAQTNSNDTLRMDTSMFRIAEVTVEAQSVIQKVDKQVLLPNREQRKASHDGMSLLQNLQIPRIVVNPADNTVKTLANQDVQLRINGIEARRSWRLTPKMSSVSSTTTSRVCAITARRRSLTTSSSTATRAVI